jgi:glucuronokinase
MPSSRAHAYPRLGILGNPSDGYGGRVLSLTFSNFKAEVEAIDAGPSVRELFERLDSGAAEGIETLTTAAARSYARAHPLPDTTRLSFSTVTDIPRQAGLAGSSAIVTAALRALAGTLGVHLSPRELALLAWEAETRELGIEAGPQDRVAQAHGGLLDMDFSKPWSEDSFRSVDPTLLPAMLVAWDSRPGSPSGDVHDEVRARHEARDPEVTQAMERFPQIAADGVLALERGDLTEFLDCMNANFDLRAGIWSLSPGDLELVSIGREVGCATKFPGSGGAVICAAPDVATLVVAEEAYASRGLNTIRPTAADLIDGVSS